MKRTQPLQHVLPQYIDGRSHKIFRDGPRSAMQRDGQSSSTRDATHKDHVVNRRRVTKKSQTRKGEPEDQV